MRKSIVRFVLGALLVALSWPAAAQPPGQVYRIGFLSTDPPSAPLWNAFLDGLRERGYSGG